MTPAPVHPRRGRGFTMIEIVLVLLILAIALALAAPSLRGWGQGAMLRDEAERLAAAARWARAEAVATADAHRLDVDASAASYAVSVRRGVDYAPVAGEFGRPTRLPAGYRLRIASGGLDDRSVEFAPNGRATPAVLQLTAAGGEVAEVACRFPADLFRVRAIGGAR